MRDRIIAVDPGVMSGLAQRYSETWHTAQFTFPNLCAWIDAFAIDLETIVCESYTITAETVKKSRQPASLETIGFLRYVALREDIPFILQSPADAKRFVTNDRLKAAGWYQGGKNDHADDASRHLMLHLIKTGQMEVPRAAPKLPCTCQQMGNGIVSGNDGLLSDPNCQRHA